MLCDRISAQPDKDLADILSLSGTWADFAGPDLEADYLGISPAGDVEYSFCADLC